MATWGLYDHLTGEVLRWVIPGCRWEVTVASCCSTAPLGRHLQRKWWAESSKIRVLNSTLTHPLREELGLAQGKDKHKHMGSGQWPGLVMGFEGERLEIGFWAETCGWTYGSGDWVWGCVPLSVTRPFSLATAMIFLSFQQFDYYMPMSCFLSILSGVRWTSWVCKLMLSTKLRKVLIVTYLNILCPISISFHSKIPVVNILEFYIDLQITRLCSFCQCFFKITTV